MSEQFSKQVEEIALRGLALMRVPGVAVAVVKDGETILAEGYGLANIEAAENMTAEHVMPIGSSSKAFTATGAAMLVSEGKLALDTPVRAYMPRFSLSDPVAAQSATTRDLLCHRTGLPRHDLLWITWPDVERDELMFERLPHLGASAPFRSIWQYNNHMFGVAGRLIAELTGKSWETFTRERLFAPLGMRKSSFWQDAPDGEQKYATLYKEKDGAAAPCATECVPAVGPAGAIRSTVNDMARWLKFNLARGKFDNTELLSEAAFAELWTPNIPYKLFPFEVEQVRRIGYALGWFVDSYRGELRVDHGGNVSGSTTLVSMLPEKNIGVVVLTNADSNVLTYALVSAIQDILLGKPNETDWLNFYQDKYDEMKRKSDEDIAKLLGEKLPDKPATHALDEYAGIYANPGYGKIRVFADAGLNVDMHGNIFPLEHRHYDIFSVKIHDVPIPVSFKTAVDGSIEAISIQLELSLPEPIVYKRAAPAASEAAAPEKTTSEAAASEEP
ncbi:MAG: serine hydrolase [Clostridiales bacterium]|nr:serine hydrolase [Clostridiales bacterium]